MSTSTYVMYFDMIVPFIRKWLVGYEEQKEVRGFKLEVAETILSQLDINELTKEDLTEEFKKSTLERVRNMKTIVPVSKKVEEKPSNPEINLNELLSMFTGIQRPSATTRSDNQTTPDMDDIMNRLGASRNLDNVTETPSISPLLNGIISGLLSGRQ